MDMPPKSISVHSLIDKDRKDLELHKSPHIPSIQEPRGTMGATNPKQHLQTVLEQDFKDFPFSEAAFFEMIKLKVQQEKTKQDQIKLDIAKKNHDIITTAMNANVPGNMIPSMCVIIKDTEVENSRSNSVDYTSLPMNYKFGDSNATSNTSASSSNPVLKRPISPGKMANITSPTTSYRFPNRVAFSHQRHYSMPVVKNPINHNMDVNRIDNQSHLYQHPQVQNYPQYYSSSPYVQSYQYPPPRPPPARGSPGKSHSRTGSLRSNSPATLQVKPLPSRAKQNQNPPPSQESMTSFQRVIQFQHWNPDSPGPPPSGSGSGSGSSGPISGPSLGVSGIPAERSHKRHKSHMDNMSVDLGGPGTIKEEDVSMEYEDKK